MNKNGIKKEKFNLLSNPKFDLLPDLAARPPRVCTTPGC